MKRDGNGRQIVIIGGGPAGMEAALLASRRGFRVTLFEKSGKLGGSIDLPRIAHGMSKVGYSVDAFVSRIMASDVDVVMNTEIKSYEQIASLDVDVVMNTEIKSYEQIASLKPYAVVVATGGFPAKFNIPGIEQENVVQAVDVLRCPENYIGKNIVLVGSGMTGLETAEVLAGHGCSVNIFEMQDEIAKNANVKNKYAVLNYLLSKGVQVHLNRKLNYINNETVEFENLAEQKKETYTADVIVLSMGVKPSSAIVEELRGKVSNLITAGDCSDGRLVVHATSKAFASIWNLE